MSGFLAGVAFSALLLGWIVACMIFWAVIGVLIHRHTSRPAAWYGYMAALVFVGLPVTINGGAALYPMFSSWTSAG